MKIKELTLEIGNIYENYDLGENETEQDVQKYYPNYKRDEND